MATLKDRAPVIGARERYRRDVADMNRLYGHLTDRWRLILEQLDAGEPVVVHHGWQLGLRPPNVGPWLLEPDGSVVAVMRIRDGVQDINYQRPDGSLVYEGRP